jgi:hypothetical protein
MLTITDVLQKGNLTKIVYEKWLELYNQRCNQFIWFTAKPLDEMHSQKMSVGISGFMCFWEEEVTFIVRNTHTGFVRVLNKFDFTSEFAGELFSFPGIYYKPHSFIFTSNDVICDENKSEDGSIYTYNEFYNYHWLHNGDKPQKKVYIQGLFDLRQWYDWLVFTDSTYKFFCDNGSEVDSLWDVVQANPLITKRNIIYPNGADLCINLDGICVLDKHLERTRFIPIHRTHNAIDPNDVFDLINVFMRHNAAVASFLEAIK